MARPRGFGKGPTGRFNIRLDDDTAAFYRKQASLHGTTLSEFLRHLLIQGMIAESVTDIEERLGALIRQSAAISAQSKGAEIPDDMLLSVFTSEALLAAIVEARDVQALYTAQRLAKARLGRLKAS